jgi:hypothetical protein
MTKHTGIRLVVAAGLALGVVAGLVAHAPASPAQAQARTTWTAEDALPLTCAQAWVEAGKTYKGLLGIITPLAIVSLANRDLTFPNTKEAGVDAGKGIIADCKADPDALLFAIVDKHVRRVAEATQ